MEEKYFVRSFYETKKICSNGCSGCSSYWRCIFIYRVLARNVRRRKWYPRAEVLLPEVVEEILAVLERRGCLLQTSFINPNLVPGFG